MVSGLKAKDEMQGKIVIEANVDAAVFATYERKEMGEYYLQLEVCTNGMSCLTLAASH